MNYSKAIFLINDSTRAMRVNYSNGDRTTDKDTLVKTLDSNLKEDDYVVVETDTRHGMTVVKILETDVLMDFDSPENIRWIVGKVDYASHQNLLAQENEAIQSIKSAELRKKRDDLRGSLLKDSMETIKQLPIAKISN